MSMEQKSTTSKLLTGMVVGALVGAAAVLFDSSTRTKVMESTGEAKDRTMRMARDVKDNPEAVKEDAMDRIQGATNVLKEAIENLQSLYNKTGAKVADQADTLKEDAEGLMSKAREDGTDLDGLGTRAQQAKEDTESIVSVAKEAGGDLEGLGAKVKEAKDELLKESSRGSSSGDSSDELRKGNMIKGQPTSDDGETDHSMTDRPV